MSNEWQPIETAPKDGIAILAYVPDPWSNEESIQIQVIVNWGGRYGIHSSNPKWVCSIYEAFNFKPTHWMPLPTPPQP